jgi:actin-related protein
MIEAKIGAQAMPQYLARLPQGQRQQAKESACAGYHDYMRMKIGRDGKDTIAKIAEYGYTSEDPRFGNMIRQPYELPDGTKVELGVERFETGELLFGRKNASRENAPLEGFSTAAIQSLVCDSVFRCEREQQAALLSTVVLAGGGSCLDGAVDRLRMEVEGLVHVHTPGWRVKVLGPSPSERRVCSWMGGSILASLGSFNENWMTKAEYEEHGSTLVNRKCP